MAAISKLTNLASSGVRYLFIGNPGVGKSTILNGLVGLPVFKSGISYGKGMTFRFDKHVEGNNTYMDTPGLADPEMRKQAAAAITEALKQNGFYKIFFVVCLQNGRVKAEDVTTMKLVLDAAPITNYGIIINQVPGKQYHDLLANPEKQDPAPFEKVCASLTPAMSKGKASLRVHVMKRDDDLEDGDNVVKPLPADLLAFLEATPGMDISASKVQEVSGKSFEDLQEEMERKIQDLQEQNSCLQRSLDQQNLEVQSLRSQLVEQQAEMERALARQKERTEALLKQAQEDFEKEKKALQESFNSQMQELKQDFDQQLLDQSEAHQKQVRLLNKTMETLKHDHSQSMSRLEKELKEARNRIGFADVLGGIALVGLPNLIAKIDKAY